MCKNSYHRVATMLRRNLSRFLLVGVAKKWAWLGKNFFQAYYYLTIHKILQIRPCFCALAKVQTQLQTLYGSISLSKSSTSELPSDSYIPVDETVAHLLASGLYDTIHHQALLSQKRIDVLTDLGWCLGCLSTLSQTRKYMLANLATSQQLTRTLRSC